MVIFFILGSLIVLVGTKDAIISIGSRACFNL